MTLPAHSEISICLSQIDAVHSASEAHGVLCALLIQDVSTGVDGFLQMLLGDSVQDADQDSSAFSELVTLYQETLKQLQDPLLGLELLLPDEEESLDERVQAATQWAGGFLFAWLKSNQHRNGELSAEIDEFIEDCKVLVTTEFQIDAEDSDDEAIYMELVEYLRLGALLVQEEIQPIKAPPQIH